jgi:hypothetical protein
MRSRVPLAVLVLLAVTSVPSCAYGADNNIPNQQSIDALEAKASQAPAREQCFLYAKLVHEMTELSLRQYAAGDVEKATGLLLQIQQHVNKIHLSVAENNKRLKDAEILLRRTAFRLTEMLHSSGYEDRPLVERTLAQVNHAETETMMQVFRK